MEFEVLGPVVLRRDGRAEPQTGRLRRVLLGVLLARANRPVPVDALVDALWGERPDQRAGARLQLHVHRLRAALDEPDRLSFEAAGYRLLVRPGELDAERFESLVTAAVGAVEREPQGAVETARTALALWRGVPFADLDLPVLTDWAHRLAECRLVALETLYQAELACGLDAAIVWELTALVREHPGRERPPALLMTALHRAGRSAEALAVYRRTRETLAGEFGLAPGPELRAVERQVRAGQQD